MCTEQVNESLEGIEAGASPSAPSVADAVRPESAGGIPGRAGWPLSSDSPHFFKVSFLQHWEPNSLDVRSPTEG